MGLEEDWILFLEKNPQFYELSKGDFFIQFLEKISESAKSFVDLKVSFPNIEEGDLQVIMDALVKLKVISQAVVGPNVFYILTPDGKKLLSVYRKTKKFFST